MFRALALSSFSLLYPVVGAQDEPTLAEVFVDMPDELVALTRRLSDRAGLGAQLATALGSPSGSKSKALERLHRELPAWLQGTQHDDLIQASTGSEAGAYWYAFTFLAWDLGTIEEGENAQGDVLEDSGWRAGRRTFGLRKDGIVCRLRQVRARLGTLLLQRSGYYWQRGGYEGRGIDWLVPVVAANGEVRGHLLISIYSHDYDAQDRKGMGAGSAQREAVRDWMKRTRQVYETNSAEHALRLRT